MHKKTLNIYHAASSGRNPLTWRQARQYIMAFWNTYQSKKRLTTCNYFVTESETILKLVQLRYSIPIAIYKRLSFLVNEKTRKNVDKMIKVRAKGQQVMDMFTFFVTHEWIFDCSNYQQLWDFVTPEEREEYLIDMADVDIRRMIDINNYGIKKYILKEEIENHWPKL